MARVLTISRLRLLLCVCVYMCVLEVVKHGMKRGEGTCTKYMVITVEEVMESGHFYGSPDLPPEPFKIVNMLFELPFKVNIEVHLL